MQSLLMRGALGATVAYLAAADGNIRTAPTPAAAATEWVSGPSVTVEYGNATVVPSNGETDPEEIQVAEPKIDLGPTVSPAKDGWLQNLFGKLFGGDDGDELMTEREVGSSWYLVKSGVVDSTGKPIELFDDTTSIDEVRLTLGSGLDSEHIQGTIKVDGELKFFLLGLNESAASTSLVNTSGLPSVTAMPIEYTLTQIIGDSVAVVEGPFLDFRKAEVGRARFVDADAAVYQPEYLRDLAAGSQQEVEGFLPEFVYQTLSKTALSTVYNCELLGQSKTYFWNATVHVNNKFSISEDAGVDSVDVSDNTEIIRNIISTATTVAVTGLGNDEQLVVTSSALQKEVVFRSVAARKYPSRYVAEKESFTGGDGFANLSGDINLVLTEEAADSLRIAIQVVNSYIISVKVEADGAVASRGTLISTQMAVATEQMAAEEAVANLLQKLDAVKLDEDGANLISQDGSLRFKRSYVIYVAAEAGDSVIAELTRRRLQELDETFRAEEIEAYVEGDPTATAPTTITTTTTTTTTATAGTATPEAPTATAETPTATPETPTATPETYTVSTAEAGGTTTTTPGTMTGVGQALQGLSERCTNTSQPKLYQAVESTYQGEGAFYAGVHAPVSLSLLYNDSLGAYEAGLYAANYTTFTLSTDNPPTISSIHVQRGLYNFTAINSVETTVWGLLNDMKSINVQDEYVQLQSNKNESLTFALNSVYHMNVTSLYDTHGEQQRIGTLTIPMLLSRSTFEESTNVDYDFLLYLVDMHKGTLRITPTGAAAVNGDIASTNLARFAPTGRVNAAREVLDLLWNTTGVVINDNGCSLTIIADKVGNVTLEHAANDYSALFSMPLLRPTVPFVSFEPVRVNNTNLDLTGNLHFHNDWVFYMQSNATIYPTVYVNRTSNNRVTIPQFLSEIELTNRFRTSYDLNNQYYFGVLYAPLSFSGLALRGYDGSDDSLAAKLFEGLSDSVNVTLLGISSNGQFEPAMETLLGSSVFAGAISINGESAVELSLGKTALNISISAPENEKNIISVEGGLSGSAAISEYGQKVEKALKSATILRRSDDGTYSLCNSEETTCVILEVEPFF